MADGMQPALVLDQDVASDEAVHFAGFPGLWFNGQPIALSELGFDSEDAAAAAVEAAGVPLELTTVADGEGLMPDLAGGPTPGLELAADEVFPPNPVRPDEEAALAEAIEEHAQSLLAENAPDVIAAVADITDLHELAQLLADEQAGKSRTTVLDAIAARQAELAPADENNPADESGATP